MIWFGRLKNAVVTPGPEAVVPASEHERMQIALERVAEVCPSLSGRARLEALAATGWVDLPTAERLLPHFHLFDPDRHFAEYLRRLSFGGRPVAEEFRGGVRYVMEDVFGNAWHDQLGPEPCIRFTVGDFQGVVLAQPEVGFTINGQTRDAVAAAAEEMPDALTIVAKSFERGAAEQVAGILHRTGLRGTLVTVNLLLGLRATAIRYQPRISRIIDTLSTGGQLKSVDLARLGDRELAA